MNRITRKKVTIPTYRAGASEPLPVYPEKRPYQGASGRVYPLPYTGTVSDERTDVAYDVIALENDYVRVQLLPALGGKIHSALDKTNGYDFIYHNRVIKPAMVGLAGPWVSGGIEFNFPQHHRPTTFMPAETAVRGKTAYMGEFDYFHGMKGMIALSLAENGSRIEAEITVYNGTGEQHPFMWWANMAVEVNDDYKIVFPPDVEFVNDHDRRAVLEWPVARGIYRTARPFDYGEGTDIHAFPAVKVPSSFMVARGQSEGDFVCGYDCARQAGVVTVADHHIAPGKKLWTWGDGSFGSKWCANLTDDGSRYVELMTGCYTDNQPDFTWIAPYETKKFTQYWYPVRDIGEVKCASKAGACNLEQREGGVFVGYYSAEKRECVVTLTHGDAVLFERRIELSPQKTLCETVKTDVPCSELMLTVRDENGILLRYREPVRGHKKPIEPRLPAKRPCDCTTVEELWLNGIHLAQYKHFAYRPEDYFREGLSRDAYDVRCNHAMGDLLLERGLYKQAAEHYTRAAERLALRNCNPYDTEPLYKRALCEFRQGELAQAERDAYAAVWSYPMRSAGYYLLAKIKAKQGDREAAIACLEQSLETNAGHLWAHYIRGLLLHDGKTEERLRRLDPLFLPDGSERRAVGFAVELCDFGLYGEAAQILHNAQDGAVKYYHLAEIYRLTGDSGKRAECLLRGGECGWEGEFPSLRESEDVFKNAATSMAFYYLGCLYYRFERYEEACAAWERAISQRELAPAYRNLALGYYDHLGKKERARECLERAFSLMPESGRCFYELTQMYKSLNLPLQERIALYESAPALTAKRDDCTLAYSVLLTQAGEYERAVGVLAEHSFHTYEGGEGYLTQHHAWLHLLIGQSLMAKGEYTQAIGVLQSGLTFPENYGEEKNYFVNDAPLYYALSQCYAHTGEETLRKCALENAVSTKGAPTIHSYWQCLAYRAMGDVRAEALADEMRRIGERILDNAEQDDYFGVGAPSYAPFCYDIARAHRLTGTVLCAFGALARGDAAQAAVLCGEAERIDSADFSVFLLKLQLKGQYAEI